MSGGSQKCTRSPDVDDLVLGGHTDIGVRTALSQVTPGDSNSYTSFEVETFLWTMVTSRDKKRCGYR